MWIILCGVRAIKDAKFSSNTMMVDYNLVGDVGTHTDLDMDTKFDIDIDPCTEAHNMVMVKYNFSSIYYSIETRRATINFDCFLEHIDLHLNLSNFDYKDCNSLAMNIYRKHPLYYSCIEKWINSLKQ